MLTPEQRLAALAIARAAVAGRVTGQCAVAGALALPGASAAGVFVTLSIDGQLRGCLGTIEGDDGLALDIARCAADASAEDPRFPPLSPGELGRVSIEISILGPLEPIAPPFEGTIAIGVHGLLVESGRHRGLLLPQVATEWRWTPEQFLRQACVKAGLDGDAWQRGAQVFRFTADVFGERHV